jgi:hypothetical protein
MVRVSRMVKSLSAAAVLLLAARANAGTVTFNFLQPATSGGDTWSVTNADGTISTTAQPQLFGGSLGQFPLLTQSSTAGLGVAELGNPLLPGINQFEGINFTFNPANVTLDSVTFTLINSTTRIFGFKVDSDEVIITDYNGQTDFQPITNGVVTVPLNSSALAGLTIAAGCDLVEDFGIGSIQVSYNGATAVPLPAAIWGGGALLGVLAGARRIRRNRA